MRPSLSALLATLALIILSFASASAAPTAEKNYRVSFTDDFDSCSGERVVVTGEQHIVEQATVDGAGQTHIVFHRNTFGTGVGAVSGAEYQMFDTVNLGERVESVQGGTTIYTQFYETAIVRKGETGTGDDSYVRMMTRITIAPDETQTVEIEFLSVTCR